MTHRSLLRAPLSNARVASAVAAVEPARKWLNWLREDASGGTSDDPLEGHSFASLWTKSKATATIDEIKLAEASLATD